MRGALVNSKSKLVDSLTVKQKTLVDTIVATGCSITKASKLAGYKGNSARVSASKALQLPKVQEYYTSQLRHKLNQSSAKALESLVSLSSGAKSEYVQLEASKDILDRSGFKAPEKHQHMLAGDFNIKIDLG
jgi:phage terminase small subunit